MELGLKNRIALVSASSQGLGKAAARSLAQEGATLAICSRNEQAIHAAAEEICTATGAVVLPVVADVMKEDDITRMIGTVMKEFGRIDILVNNAGGPPTGKITTMTDGDWDRGVELTLKSMVRMTRAVLPGMEERKWGRVITIASITAKQPVDELLLSSVLRPGILGLTKVLSNQYAASNITVNTVCPGYILTKRQEELSRSRSLEQKKTMEEYLAESARNIPIGRLGRPEEIGDVIAFLASERASFITGANLMVDGGQSKAI
jgi:3-oxoacyl-[acyl-carrier protein] reductase